MTIQVGDTVQIVNGMGGKTSTITATVTDELTRGGTRWLWVSVRGTGSFPLPESKLQKS